MSDRRISDLTELTDPASGDYFPIVDISEAAAASKNKRITMATTLRGAPSGTAAAPAFAFVADPDTGFYNSAANQIAIAASGTLIGAFSASGLTISGQVSGRYTNVGLNTAAQGLATNVVSQVIISADTTLTTTVPPAGSEACVIIQTSGTTTRTVTFGTGFASTGTLATGASNDRRFVVRFVSDGTRLLESSRTTAITV